MCGRYVIARAVGDLVAATGAVPDESLGEADTERLRANWNTAPTTDVPIVLERLTGGGGRDDVRRRDLGQRGDQPRLVRLAGTVLLRVRRAAGGSARLHRRPWPCRR